MQKGHAPYKPSIAARILKILWRIFLGLALVFSLAVIGVYGVCLFGREYVAGQASYRLQQRTGQPWRVEGPVLPQLFPGPGVLLKNVTLVAASEAREMEAGQAPPFASIRQIKVNLDFWPLLAGKVSLKSVDVRSVHISMAYGLDGLPLWETEPLEEFDHQAESGTTSAEKTLQELGPDEPASSPQNADAPAGAPSGKNATSPPAKETVKVPEKAAPTGKGEKAAQESAPKPGEGKEAAPGEALPSVLQTRAESPLSPILKQMADLLDPDFREYLPVVTVSDGLFEYYDQQGNLIVRIGEGELSFEPLVADDPLIFSGFTAFPSAGVSARFHAEVNLGEDVSLLQGQVRGNMLIAPVETLKKSVDFSFPFSWNRSGSAVNMPGLTLACGEDVISADLTLDLVRSAITGPVRAHHINMPDWFKFARNLPPGLQHSLADLSGTFSLTLNRDGVLGTNGSFESKGLAITGSVSAPDFAKPVVVVDLDIPEVDLDVVFPFLATSDREVPEWDDLTFPYPPLVPYPGEGGPDESGGPDVGYDVTVRVVKGQAHGVPANNAVVRVLPDKHDNTIVTFTIPDYLKGNLKGRLEIADRSVAMVYEASRLNIALSPENASGSAVFGGLFTGKVELLVEVDKEGFWKDPWGLKLSGELANGTIGGRGGGKWKLNAKKVDVSGEGLVSTVRAEGFKAQGTWRINSQGVSSSWHPGGNDRLEGVLEGAIAWAPQPPPAEQGKPVKYWRGIARISGDLTGSGTLGLPISTHISPTAGKFSTKLDWSLMSDQVTLKETAFEGMGGLYKGDVALDFSKDVVYEAKGEAMLQPKVLLQAWKMMPESFVLPDLVTGTYNLKGDSQQFAITDLGIKVDGSAVRGSITRRVTGSIPVPAAIAARDKAAGHVSRATLSKGLWTINLDADLLDLDKYLPSSPKGTPPSKTPWDLDSLYGQDISADISLKAMRYKKLNAAQGKLVFTLKDENMLSQFTSPSFYGGSLDIKVQGAITPLSSEVKLTRGQGGAKNFALDRLFSDMSGEASPYGGKGEIQFDLKGAMHNNADLPGGLSGTWGLLILDGTYPAFLGSGSGLRNTFNKAAVSGVMENGVMRWNNFSLTGAMVDMEGRGQVDLNNNTMDVSVEATLARVPTIPMHITGDIDNPKMTVRGQALITQNVGAAGSTIFGLIRGVFELPVRAVQGVGGLISGDKEKDKPDNRPAPGGAVRSTQETGN